MTTKTEDNQNHINDQTIKIRLNKITQYFLQ